MFLCISALPMPIAIRMDKHWAAGMRAKEWVRNDWNCLLLPVTMAVFYSFSSFALPLPFSFSLFFWCLHTAETRMIAVYMRQESLCACVYVRESYECVNRESTLNVASVHWAEVSSVVLCTSSTTTVARAHTYFFLYRYCYSTVTIKFVKFSSID